MNIAISKTIEDLLQEQHYDHYSFDLWLTLIRSHPQFKPERAHFFYQYYNPSGKSLEAVTQAFRKVDDMCNAINEKTGKNIEAEEMYLMVLYELNPKADFCKLDLVQLYNAVEAMVLQYPPQLYATHTIDVLQQLKVSGATLNVLSNTAFIKGCTLRKVFNKIGLNDLFDFHLFSDETGVSKPNPNMFTLMHQQARAYHPNILPEDILHIGDNPRADIAGARAQGFQTFLVHQL